MVGSQEYPIKSTLKKARPEEICVRIVNNGLYFTNRHMFYIEEELVS